MKRMEILKEYLKMKKRKGLSMEMLIMILLAIGLMGTLGPIFLNAISQAGDQASNCGVLVSTLSDASSGAIEAC